MTASAVGYYHYLAWDTCHNDTCHNNVWPSARPIKRMYWYYDNGGYGASIKCDIAGVNFDWVWFPMSDDGGPEFVGYADEVLHHTWL